MCGSADILSGVERLRLRHRCAVRAVALLTLLGLVGMHGLPDAMAGPGGAPAMQGNASMFSPHAASAPASESAAMLPARSGQSAVRSVAAPVGCPMGHAGCVAVVRDAGQMAPAVAVLAVVAVTAVTPGSAPVTNPANGPRAPPYVSLLGLGISRT